MKGPRSSKPGRPGAIAAAFAEGLPIVVLVGRVNAGKSTLFNRLAQGAHAITSPVPGTTRDLNIGHARIGDRNSIIVDSGGLELGGNTRLSERIASDALAAIGAADLVVMVLDGREGFSEADSEALALIRETGCPLILAVNKIDNPGQDAAASEFYASGAEKLFFISAAHGRGIGELSDEIEARLPAKEAKPAEQPELKIALVGRPNVGKSSLLNRLCGFERSIVEEIPGTTRDTVDVRVETKGRKLLLVDTAGIRRRTRIDEDLEQASVGRAIGAIRRADVVLLVIDVTEGITDQDARLASLVDRNDRAMVVVCNKWDLAAKQGRRVPRFVADAHRRFPFLAHAPMLFTSAATGDGVSEIIPAAFEAGKSWRATFRTAQLNRILAEATAATDPPLVARRRLNLMYVTQIASAPPRLAFFTNVERDIPAHYIRFLETRFRDALHLTGTPLRLQFRRTGRDEGASPARPRARRGESRRGRAHN